ncbi:hypothetical protein C0991_012512, partial [Blastosporella zonata]
LSRSMIVLRSALLVIAIALLLGFWPKLYVHYYRYTHSRPLVEPGPVWSSPISSWYNRSLLTPHPNPHTFNPTADNLILIAYSNSMMGINLSVALFSLPSPSHDSLESGPEEQSIESAGGVVVNGLGRILLITANDMQGLSSLVEQVRKLPKTPYGWALKSEVSCTTDDLLYLPPQRQPAVALPSDGKPTCEGRFEGQIGITVNAFNKRVKELEKPTMGFTGLPDALWELLGLLGEVGWSWDDDEDKHVLEKMEKFHSMKLPL